MGVFDRREGALHGEGGHERLGPLVPELRLRILAGCLDVVVAEDGRLLVDALVAAVGLIAAQERQLALLAVRVGDGAGHLQVVHRQAVGVRKAHADLHRLARRVMETLGADARERVAVAQLDARTPREHVAPELVVIGVADAVAEAPRLVAREENDLAAAAVLHDEERGLEGTRVARESEGLRARLQREAVQPAVPLAARLPDADILRVA